MKKLKYQIRKYVNAIGLDVYPYDYRNSVQTYLVNLFRKRGIEEIWDIGANKGQYAEMLRRIGFDKNIISFEALPSAYQILENKAVNDNAWTTHGPFAVSNHDGPLPFFETEDNVSSSGMSPKFSKIKKEFIVENKKLSTFLVDIKSDRRRLLKMDVQGAEKSVIESCGSYLYKFDFIQLEASIKPMYEGEENYLAIIEYLAQKKYAPIFFFPGVGDKNFDLLQLEIFFKKL